MTQEEFAFRLRLKLARDRDWEQGRSTPDVTAHAYLTIIEREPQAVERALAKAWQKISNDKKDPGRPAR